MTAKLALSICVACFVGFSAVAADAPPAKVNYKDNVAPIFQAKCNGCHNGDKQKGGLVL